LKQIKCTNIKFFLCYLEMQVSSTSFGNPNQQLLYSLPQHFSSYNPKSQFNFIPFAAFQTEPPITPYNPSPSLLPFPSSQPFPFKQENLFNSHQNNAPVVQNPDGFFINVKDEPYIHMKHEDYSIDNFEGSPVIEQVKIEVKREDDQVPSSLLNPQSKKISKIPKKPFVSETTFQAPSQLNKRRPSIKKTRRTWSPEEDVQLLGFIEKYGKKWAKIASCMKSRNGKQVRDHYLNALAPDINRGVWTEEEDKAIIFYYKKYGAQWCKIAECLSGRTETQVKGRFYTNLKQKFMMKNVKVEIIIDEFIKEEEEF